MKIIIVIPAYNPDNKMLKLISDINNSTELSIQNETEVVVVDDGSCLDSELIFDRARGLGTKVIIHEKNRGKGAALKTAMKYINEKDEENSGVVFVDADGQHKINDILNVVNTLQKNKDALILGSRHFKGDVPFRSKFGNILTKYIFLFSTGSKVEDTQTGLRAFYSNKIPYFLSISGDRYEYEMDELLYAAKDGIEIKETNIECIYIDDNKSSHFRPIQDSYRIYKEIFKFCGVSLLSFIIDYVLFMIFHFSIKSIILSNIFARIISATFNFTMNKKVVFRNKENCTLQIVKYLSLASTILVFNTIILKCFVDVLGINTLISKIIVEMLMFVVNFCIQKIFVFTNKKKELA